MGSEAPFALVADWPVRTLAEACSAAGGSVQTGPFGSQLHKSDYVSNGIPSIMPINIGDNRIDSTDIAMVGAADVERLARHRVRPGDIVYSRRGDVRRRALVRDEQAGWLCGTGCLRVRPGEGVLDPGYLSYYLGHSEVQDWIERHAIGATMPNLNTGILGALPVVVPPLAEQHAIASILGALDDKIELNCRMSRTLGEMVQAIFKSRFEDSVQGELPSGWTWGRVRDLVVVNRNPVDPRRHPDEIFDHYSIPAFDDGQLPATQSGSEIKSTKNRVMQDGVLLSKLNPRTPRVWWPVLHGTRRSIASTEFLVLTPSRTATREFVYGIMSSRLVSEGMRSLVTGTSGSHQRVAPESMLDIPVPVPSPSVITEFSKTVACLHARRATLRSESWALSSTRDTLLPSVLSGEIKITMFSTNGA
ncbi:MAG: restriction endonuclease subunit S [Actinomycetota bacterium]|nr:restriction endonuclease subunit S [Actinomycetota bacterium]